MGFNSAFKELIDMVRGNVRHPTVFARTERQYGGRHCQNLNKKGNVRINVIFRCCRVTIVAVEKQ